MDNIIACGPFIGSFESEIIMFQPFVKWLIDTLKPSKVYVGSHKNRQFLYPKDILFFPVYENLTRNEFAQDTIIHGDVSSKDYNLIVKKFKHDINRQDISYYTLSYNKFSWIPEYKRQFTPFQVTKKKPSKILFIPSDVEKQSIINELYKKISCVPNMEVIGDMRSWLPEQNLLLKDSLYFHNVYKNMIDYISSAKAVICPSSHWTLICDLHKIPCFSWGKYTGPDVSYKNTYIINNNDMTVDYLVKRINMWLLQFLS